MWHNNLKISEKLSSMIQSRCNIYSHFLKPFHWNIHKLWHQAFIMKITVEDFEKIVKSPHFLHFTSIYCLVLKIRSSFDKWCKKYSVHKSQNLLDDNLWKNEAQVNICVKLMLIKSNPVVFLLIPKD